MDSFDFVEVLAKFSKSMRHGLISIQSLNDVDGVDRQKVKALADSVRHVHEETAIYLASIIGSPRACSSSNSV
jgi:hypothetical protein